MGKRGPAPTPAKILKMRGTYRPERDAPNAPEPPTPDAAPELPDWFGTEAPWGETAVEAYRYLSGLLLDLGLLSEIDRDALMLYCDAFGRWRYWRGRLGALGEWSQTTESGYVAPRPEVSYMNRAADDMRKWGALFGLTPSDRRNVSAAPKDSAGDEAADFLFGARKA